MKPPASSPLALAAAVQRRASLRGFDWTDPADALAKVGEEAEEVAIALADTAADDRAAPRGTSEPRSRPGAEVRENVPKVRESVPKVRENVADDGGKLAEELGDLLFAVVNVARIAGIDPDAALLRATGKFRRRFAHVERIADERGLPMPGTPLPQLDQIWDEVKSIGGPV